MKITAKQTFTDSVKKSFINYWVLHMEKIMLYYIH